jgi:hypothetical protein
MADRMFINQEINIGAETVAGTNVAAGKRITAFTWADGIMADVKDYQGTGRKYVDSQIEEKEWMEWDVSGDMDFNSILYIAAGVYGKVTPALVGSSTTAYAWTFTPPIAGAASPQTYTIEQGDAVRAHKANFLMLSDFGYKLVRGSGDYSMTAKGFSRAIQDAIMLTASPTAIALSPAAPNMANIYLDTTSAGLGTTQLVTPLSFEYNHASVYGMFWALNRTQSSFTGYSDLKPKTTGKLKMEANAEGMAMLAYLQSQTTYYMRTDTLGPVIDGTHSINAEIKHDMAIKFGKPSKFEDDQGLFAIEWEFTVVEDPAWGTGTAEIFTVTNLLATL